ncbi:hypothetical protein PGQ11_000997 [Apiospora arundinis]
MTISLYLSPHPSFVTLTWGLLIPTSAVMGNPPHTVCAYFPDGCNAFIFERIWRRGPKEAFINISQSLYKKAGTQNEELSDDERALFLTRGDLAGKALAHPESLSLAEKYEIMGFLPPEQLHNTIRGTPQELLDKARQDPSLESLTLDELELLVTGFQPADAYRQIGGWKTFPGNEETRRLIQAREGISVVELEAFSRKAAMRCMTNPQIRIERYAKFAAAEAAGKTGLLVQEVEPLGCRPRDDDIIREALQAMAEADARTMGLSAPPEFEPEPESEAPPPPRIPSPHPAMWIEEPDGTMRDPTRDDVDRYGRPVWPPLSGRGHYRAFNYPPTPDMLFRDDEYDPEKPSEPIWAPGYKRVLRARYDGLAAEKKADYEGRSERKRREAWDEYEQMKRNDFR